jgi:beta-lactamase regulating signal transducer with metallopeptidase domain
MDALLLAVLNALWQGAALIALVALALRAGLRRNATTACVVWSVTFVVVALLPAIDLALARPASPVAATAAASPQTLEARSARDARDARISATLAAPRSASRQAGLVAPAASGARAADVRFALAPAPADRAVTPVHVVVAQRVGDGAVRVGGAATAFARAWGFAVLALWALVAGALLLRLVIAYAAVGRMKRDATPIDDPLFLSRLRAAGHRRRAAVAQSAHIEIPCAVGFRRPMILVPARLAGSLDGEDLARIVLHESAHLQRYDDWTNALEQVICALQFFQPALYFARRGIDFEREVACDDHVLEDAGEPLRYAECLARIVQRQVRGRQAAVVPGFVLRRAQVVARVRRIVDRSRDASPHLRIGAAVLGGGVLVASFGIARLQVPVVAPAAAAPVATAIAPSAASHSARRAPQTAARAAAHASHLAAHASHVAALASHFAANATHNSGHVHATSPHLARAASATAAALAVKRSTDAKKTAARAAQLAQAPAEPSASPSPAPSPSPSPYARVVRVPAPSAKRVRATVYTDEGAMMHPAFAPRTTTTVTVGDDVHRVAPSAMMAVEQATRTTIRSTNALAMPMTLRVNAQVVAQTAPAPVVRPKHSDGDLLDAIDEAKYPHPSVDELIALRNQGVSADYVRRMGALGRARPALKDLLALATQGVTPEYVATLDRRLASPPSLDDVMSLRVQGVSASWLDGLAAIGYPKLTPAEAASLAVQGVSVSYVRGLLEAGLRATPSQLVSLRVQGVDGAFVRRLAQHGYRNLSVDELVRLKVSGFDP